jgi:hypothetical protein
MKNYETLQKELEILQEVLLKEFRDKFKVGQLFKSPNGVVILAKPKYVTDEFMLLVPVAIGERETNAGFRHTDKKTVRVNVNTISGLIPITSLTEAIDLEKVDEIPF